RNTATGYTGSHDIAFSGASDAPDGTHPTVKDKNGNTVDFGTPTPLTFTSGVSTVSGGNNGRMALYKAETATISVTDGPNSSSGSDRLTVAVSAASAAKFQIDGPASTDASANNQPTVYALDTWRNIATGFNGTDNLTWSGASDAPDGTHPTVTDNTGTPVDFGSPVTTEFSRGVADVSTNLGGEHI